MHPGIKRYIPVVIFCSGFDVQTDGGDVAFCFAASGLLAAAPINLCENLVIEKIPLLILTVASSVVTYFVQRQVGAVATLEHFPLDVRIYNAIISYARYMEKAILP